MPGIGDEKQRYPRQTCAILQMDYEVCHQKLRNPAVGAFYRGFSAGPALPESVRAGILSYNYGP